jgi:hypothetical protein
VRALLGELVEQHRDQDFVYELFGDDKSKSFLVPSLPRDRRDGQIDEYKQGLVKEGKQNHDIDMRLLSSLLKVVWCRSVFQS